MKKISMITFALLLILPVMAFAGGNQTRSAGPVTTAAPGTGYTLPLSTTGETLRFTTTDIGTGVSLLDGVPIMNAIEKDTGVRMIWETLPDADYNAAMQIRLSAGSDLPDIAKIPGNQMAFIRQLTPLNALIDAYATNLLIWMKNESNLRKLIQAPDGEIYALPQQVYGLMGASDVNAFSPTIRKDWLDKLNIPEPVTLDDFYRILVRFKDYDPLGNGSVKVIPFAPNPAKHQAPALVGWAYGLHLHAGQGYAPNANGQIIYEWIEPTFRDVLQVMNRWWNEGLIDPMFMNFDGNQWVSQLVNSQIGATTMRSFQAENNYNNRLREATGDPNAHFWPMKPLVGPTGIVMSETDAGTINTAPGANFGLMYNSSKKDLAIKWIDYVAYSPAGIIYEDYGLEGISFVTVNGKKQWTNEYLHHADGLTTAMRKLGAYRLFMPAAYSNEGRELFFSARGEPLLNRAREVYSKLHPIMHFAIAALDETDTLNNYLTDIESYRDEMVIKFITGAEPLSRWDEYVNTIRRLNIAEVLKVKQAQYDRLK